jgi:diguanylate cyclase (GGDEF)-like protein/PAS domain S-box-containing protein
MHERTSRAPIAPAALTPTRSVAMPRVAAQRSLVRAVAVAGLALGALALTVGALAVAQHRSQVRVLHGREVSRLARTTLRLAVDQQTALRGYLLTGDSAALTRDARVRARMALVLDSLVALTADDPAQQARARGIRDGVLAWERTYRPRVLAAAAPGAGPGIADVARADVEREGAGRFEALRGRLETFVVTEEGLYRRRVAADRRTTWLALGAVLAEVLALLAMVLHVGRQARARTATVFDQQEELEAQAADLEEQALTLEEQAVELEAQTDELQAANLELGAALAEQARALAAAQASEARYRSVVETATDAIITSDASGRILFWNAAAEHVYGYTEAEAIGAPLSMLIPEARRASQVEEYARLAAGPVPEPLRAPVLRDARRKDGSVFPVELAVSRWEVDGESFVTSVVRDMSARAALESRLAHQATHDALTGLANRARFRERVAEALAAHPARPDRVAVLFVDLDDFKAVNDTAGHAVGDRVLGAVAERLRETAAGSATVARLGGDEFGVLLVDADGPADVEAVAARLVAALRRPIAVGHHEATVGMSVGIACGAPGVDADGLLRNADTAMYVAKDAGKGEYVWFAPAMHDALLERAQIQVELAPALERGEFWLAYQPIVALDAAGTPGVEALLRWTHPQRGALSPAAFIPVAEASGQIVSLGRWVLQEACRTAATLPGSPYVTVNISGRQLVDPSLVDDVTAALRASGLPAECLVLEITETVLMADTAGMLERLHELKALGVRLAIDDFGTGYSSLRYLQRFPVDVLKIDKSFVDRVDSDDHDAALVRTIVALGEMLGLQTVAEGIEREAQREHLRALGCGLGQGYHFARPLDAAGVAAFLQAADEEADAATAR